MKKKTEDTFTSGTNKKKPFYKFLSKYEETISDGDPSSETIMVKRVSSGAKRPKNLSILGKKRRTRIPDRPSSNANLWTVIKGSVGKDLNKIPMPVAFNEPLSLLQRIAECFEYSDLLDKAGSTKDTSEQMCYIAAFTVSCYSTVARRTAKPFNPLLGETFEWDRSEDLGWKLIAEQVSHHPPISAQHCTGSTWTFWEIFEMKSKFRGQYMRVQSNGLTRLDFNDGSKYSWNRINTSVNNIIMGKLWIDIDGDCTIKNHTNGWTCSLMYDPFNSNNKQKQRRVSGTVNDPDGRVVWNVEGRWDSHIQITHIDKNEPLTIWKINEPLPDSEKFYNYTLFACQMNEPERGVAPTDSRRRPDQRLMEKGDFAEADIAKGRLEEKQRAVRKLREEKNQSYSPTWFTSYNDEQARFPMYKFNGKYWDSKKSQDWSNCPDIYDID